MLPSKCPHCGSDQVYQTAMPTGVHHARIDCGKCRRFIGWVRKPENEKTKHREKDQKTLLSKYSHGFCEMCGILDEYVPNNECLVAHHVNEYGNNGNTERENIWILCSRCHALVHHERTYVSKHLLSGKCHDLFSQSSRNVEGSEAVDMLEIGA